MIDQYQNENWKQIEFEGIFPEENVHISDFGRIRSYKTSRKGGKIIGGSWLSGYNILVLRMEDDKRKTVFIHKLVAQYFLEHKVSDASFVIHIDYNRKNNHFANLKWVNRAQLSEHRKNDADYDKKKVRNSKLTETQVIRLKKMLKRGSVKPYRLAQQFGITHTQLNRIKNGENWGHIRVD
ncbi:MAG: hypothetical protein DRI84_09475 [Bacteroidetes bacterium]|nr:MAG: hypothetical protein DRI84_09475 [Bacteroidota bacterium]